MGTLAIRALLAFAGLLVSARTHVTAAMGTAHLNAPVLGVIALAVALLAGLGVLVVLRLMLRDGLRLRPRVVTL